MTTKNFLILLVDREHAKLLLISGGRVISEKIMKKDDVPQKVKHGENAWDAQDKIFRHIEEHLRRHFQNTADETIKFIKQYKVKTILIGSHKTLFPKIKDHLPTSILEKVLGTFVTELKITNKAIVDLAFKEIDKIEANQEEAKLQQSLRYG